MRGLASGVPGRALGRGAAWSSTRPTTTALWGAVVVERAKVGAGPGAPDAGLSILRAGRSLWGGTRDKAVLRRGQREEKRRARG